MDRIRIPRSLSSPQSRATKSAGAVKPVDHFYCCWAVAIYPGLMHRRIIGGLLAVVVVVLAVVIPTLGGLRRVGTASPIQLPDAPRVGDCLLEPLTDFIPTPQDGSGHSLAPSFAPCDGRDVAGEVVAVVQATGGISSRVREAEASGVGCYRSSLLYSGLALSGGRYVVPDHAPNDPVKWNLTINVRTAWVVPAPLLRTAGQSWVACIAAPLSGTTFRGRLADAFSGGKLPDEFGFCWQQRIPSAQGAVSCGGRHFAELVSLGTIPDGGLVPHADIKSSCRRLSALVIGRADPTAAGRLTVTTSVSSPRVAPVPPLPRPLNVVCYLEPLAYPLSGTVVGLGDEPIPYSK